MSTEIETGVLWRDDNVERLSDAEAFPDESVDLIYLDPPFFSNRFYEVIWGDEAEVRSFEDRWEGGIRHYIGWMRDRVVEMRRVLKPTGSLYLHCDPHASHYLKVMLDEVFGLTMFRNEVVWKRTTAHSSARRYGPVHDVILYYGNGATPTWNPQHQPYDQKYLDSKYRHVDPDTGRVYRLSDLTAAGIRRGSSGQEWRGFNPTAQGNHWKFTIENLERLDREGRIYWPQRGRGVPQFKRYLDEMPGVALQDVWTDIDPINSQARERLGYPTQKPEALLARIIAASSNPGDVVLDPFCGCGTTIAVADRLRRQWIGVDISPTAIEIMRRRLWRQGTSAAIRNAPQDAEALKRLAPFEFQNWIINAVNGTHAPRRVHDMGIDGHWFFTRDPIQVKQSEKVGRPVVDNFETALRRSGHDTGYIIAFSFTRGAAEEVARAKRDEGLNIKLVKVAEVLLLVRRPGRLERIGPQPEGDVLPLPPMRKPEELPTVEELVASDLEHQRRVAVG